MGYLTHSRGRSWERSWECTGRSVILNIQLFYCEPRARSLSASKDIEKEMLTARWEVAHDICSLVACNQAFEDCKEGTTYDLGIFILVHPCTCVTVIQMPYGLLSG
jgi:hypothetical protein